MDRPPRHRSTETLRVRGGDAVCFLAALVIGGAATDASGVEAGSYAEVNTVVGLLAAGTLWWRRRAPLVVAAATFVAAAFAPLAAGAAIVSVFNVAALRRLRVAAVVAALYLAPGAIAFALFGGGPLDGEVLGAVLFTLGALGWGVAVRARHETMLALADRAERAEAEQHARLAEARQAERIRIAAEMHDVLAHRLSMLSLHAGAIEVRADAPAEDLARAAAVVRSNAHLALDELRAVIGVLRDGDPQDLAALPGAGDLEALVEESRAAGVRVEVHADPDDLAAVPADLGRHLYRIVQEGLTNARKHAPGEPVHVAVRRTGQELHVELTNRLGDAGDAPPGGGLGLLGLRERVEAVGGSLTRDTGTTGQHRLSARLPLPT